MQHCRVRLISVDGMRGPGRIRQSAEGARSCVCNMRLGMRLNAWLLRQSDSCRLSTLPSLRDSSIFLLNPRGLARGVNTNLDYSVKRDDSCLGRLQFNKHQQGSRKPWV